MTYCDLKHTGGLAALKCDLCIIGSGPCGLTIANELGSTGLEIIIAESGGLMLDDEVQRLNEIESTGAPRLMDQRLLRRRIFGGTAEIWSGRCTILDPIDFEARKWVPNSGWPFTLETLGPYYDRATAELGCGPNVYGREAWAMLGVKPPGDPFDEDLIRDRFWQFSRSSTDQGDFERFRKRFENSPPANVKVLLNATATQILVDATGRRVKGAEFKSLTGNALVVDSRVVILCAGGIENARLLLASNRTMRYGVGNDFDSVGRYFMDHPRQTIGTIRPRGSKLVRDRFGMYRNDSSGGHVYVSGIYLSEKVQREEELLNCAVFTTEAYKSTSPWGAIKRLRSGESSVRDYWNVLSQPFTVVRGAYRRGVQNKRLRHAHVQSCNRRIRSRGP